MAHKPMGERNEVDVAAWEKLVEIAEEQSRTAATVASLLAEMRTELRVISESTANRAGAVREVKSHVSILVGGVLVGALGIIGALVAALIRGGPH